MQIFVNGEALSAELSASDTPVDVLKTMEEWVSKNSRYLLDVKVNGVEANPSDIARLNVAEVERMDFAIGDETDMVLVTVDELDHYVDQVGSTLFDCLKLTAEDVKQLREGMHWIRQVMASVSRILHLDLTQVVSPVAGEEPLDIVLSRLEASVNSFAAGTERESLDVFIEDLRSLKFYTMRLRLQLRSMHSGPEELLEALEEFEKEIPMLAEGVVNVNIAFQSGNDHRALHDLDRITERLHYSIAALFALEYQEGRAGRSGLSTFVIDGESFEDKVHKLTALLTDLSSALEAADIVAVGDILEYELSGAIRGLSPYLTEIRQFVVAGKGTPSDLRTS